MSILHDRRTFIKNAAAIPVAMGAVASLPGAALSAQPAYSGNSRIKLGCCAYSYRKYMNRGGGGEMQLDEFMQICADLGMDGVELTSYYFPEKPTNEFLMERKRKAFSLGLEISGTAVGNNFAIPDGWERHKQVAGVKEWIERGARFGAPCMRVFGGNRIPEGHTEEETHKWVVECLQECAEFGAQYGMVLVLENHGGFPEKAEQVIRILKDVNSEWCKANLDAGNFLPDDPYGGMAILAPYAANCHIKVELRGGREEAKPTADIPRIVGILKSSGYKGFVSIEYESEEDPKTAVPRFTRVIQEAIKG